MKDRVRKRFRSVAKHASLLGAMTCNCAYRS